MTVTKRTRANNLEKIRRWNRDEKIRGIGTNVVGRVHRQPKKIKGCNNKGTVERSMGRMCEVRVNPEGIIGGKNPPPLLRNWVLDVRNIQTPAL